MDIDNLALVKLTDKKSINSVVKPNYIFKKINGTKLYDTIINKLNNNKKYKSINSLFNDIYRLLPYSVEYNSYNIFYLNKIVKDNIIDNYCIIIEPLKNQINNISMIDKNKIIINKNVKLSSDAVIFTSIKEAKIYLKNNYNVKITKKLIDNLQKKYNIKKYYDPIILENDIEINNKINKLCEDHFYNFIKNYLQLDNSLSLIEIIESMDINRYKYLVKKYNKLLLKKGIRYEE